MGARDSSAATSISWLAVLALVLAFLFNLLGRGIAESFAVFLLPLERSFDWHRAEMTGIYATYMTTLGVSAPVIGALLDRFGPRVVYAVGLAMLGLGYLAAGRIDSLWQLYLSVGVLGGIGTASLGSVPASALVGRWHRRHIGRALGFAYAGPGCGILLMAPVAQILIDETGWRNGFATLGWIALAAIPLMLPLPWRRLWRGPEEDREAGDAGEVTAEEAGPDRLRQVLGSRAFWLMVLVYFLTAVSVYAVSVQVVAFLQEVGFAAIEAAGAFGIAGVLTLVGMVGSGWLVDRFGRRTASAVTYGGTLLGLIALSLIENGSDHLLLAAFVLLFGTTQGSRGPIISSLVPGAFRPRVHGVVYGGLMLGMGSGAALGALVAGWLHDVTGSYQPVFLLSAIAAVIGLAIMWTSSNLRGIRRPGASPARSALASAQRPGPRA